ncbi:MAG: hypothetical protein EOO75_00290, partial [Myxococcales bacterium]
PLPGGVVVRVAASHLRVGTFELLASRGDQAGLQALTTYALGRHYPDAVGAVNEPLALLERVVAAQASLVARWLGLGFIHGVMNTDNTSISGETIDYGPCAFLDEYVPQKTFSSIDRGGRYAYANQPRMALWNVTRLAETLIPLIDPEQGRAVAMATEQLDRFAELFGEAHSRVLHAKAGLEREEDGDVKLLQTLLDRMASGEVDFTRFRRVNPAFIPRNHRVEQLITAAVRQGDFGPFEAFHRVLARPYDDQPESASWAEPPAREERVQATFCGT